MLCMSMKCLSIVSKKRVWDGPVEVTVVTPTGVTMTRTYKQNGMPDFTPDARRAQIDLEAAYPAGSSVRIPGKPLKTEVTIDLTVAAGKSRGARSTARQCNQPQR